MQQQTAPTCAVIVVNYASSALIRLNLASIDADAQCRVIVVDNFSSTAEQHRVEAMCREHDWTCVLQPSNDGFGSGVDAGLGAARRAGATTFLVLNPDAAMDRQTADELARHATEHPRELVAPLIIRPDGTTWTQGFAVDLRSGRMRSRPGLRDLAKHEAPWLTGACLAFSADLLDLIGGMPEGYFLYWEDVDLSMKVRRSGGTLRVRDDLTVMHDEGGTQRDLSDSRTPKLSDRYYYYNCRNRLVFAARYLDRRTLLSWIAQTPRQSWLILLRGGRRQLLRSPSSLFAAVRGSLTGIAIGMRALVTAAGPAGAPTARPIGSAEAE